MFVELANGSEWVLRYWEKNMLVFHYLEYTHVRLAYEPVVPAGNHSLACCNPVAARRRDCDLSSELLI